MESRRSPMQPQLQAVRIVMMLFAVLALTLLATSCARTGAPGNCAGWKLIRGEPQDVNAISDTLALSIREHNKHWRETCK